MRLLIAGAMVISSLACASVPPEIVVAHEKEHDTLAALRLSHLEMIDGFVSEKLEIFDEFYFSQYAPAYAATWRRRFQEAQGRPYDEARDAKQFFGDVVAEYQERVAPIEDVRARLRAAVEQEYANALAIHDAVGRWISSLEKLNTSQRASVDQLIQSVKPGWDLKQVEEAVGAAVEKVRKELNPGSVQGVGQTGRAS